MLIQSGAYQFFIDFELSFMSIFPVDKANVLYVLEWPLLLVHFPMRMFEFGSNKSSICSWCVEMH